MPIKIIAFDADDTLWENEIHYLHAQEKLKILLSRYLSPEDLEDRLYETEANNLAILGMAGRVPGRVIVSSRFFTVMSSPR